MTDQSGNSGDRVKLYSLEILERACGQNRSFMNHMLQIFIRENSKAVTDIKQAYDLGNFTEVRSIAHRIKPSIHHLQMNDTLADIRTIETWDGDAAPLGILISKVCADITQVIEDLKHFTA